MKNGVLVKESVISSLSVRIDIHTGGHALADNDCNFCYVG